MMEVNCSLNCTPFEILAVVKLRVKMDEVPRLVLRTA